LAIVCVKLKEKQKVKGGMIHVYYSKRFFTPS
jgi:hypothetical protein